MRNDESSAAVRTACFAALFGLSALFHVLNAGPALRMFSDPTAESWWYVGLSVCGLALVLLPARAERASGVAGAALAVLVLATVWVEAPLLGNHWLVSGLVALGILLAVAHSAVTHRRRSWELASDLFVPVTRSVFFVFYAFSALAKINRSFLDPTVSCANFFAQDTARSLGWGSASMTGSGFWEHLLPVVVIGVEIGVLVMLSFPRSRLWGVIVAVLFHGVIALNGNHPFADFTSLVYAFMVLFLPGDFFVWLRGWLGARIRAAVIAVRVVVALAMTLLLTLHGLRLGPSWWRVSDDLKDSVWRVIGAACLVVIVAYALLGRRRTQAERLPGPACAVPRVRWLLVVPALAVLNGLTPYVGVKTGNSWNMYSNLVTAEGYENSLVVPVVWRWTDRQDDLVRILDSGDPALDDFSRNGYLVPWTNLRDYLSRVGPTRIRYVRLTDRGSSDNGSDSVVQVDDTSLDPSLSRPLSSWERRLFAFRVLDSQQPARCQDRYGPLR